jgi:hypothetical protein
MRAPCAECLEHVRAAGVLGFLAGCILFAVLYNMIP